MTVANKNKMTRHRALDLSLEVCAAAMREGFRPYDVDATPGSPKTAPCLRVKALRKDGGVYEKAALRVALADDGMRLGVPVNGWARICGGGACVRCENKADCDARYGAWGK